ncbi:MAG: GNAT family N-acetyltransferase [Bacteroidetes bacterium]|nr:GNAT family N-acetyltransferase [Bacteroidota bacterium]
MKIVNVDKHIIQELRKSGLSKEMESLENCSFLVIEERNEKIIGAGGVGGIFNIPSLQIDVKYQGQGIGKILLGEIIHEAKKRGYSFISGSRDPENSRAIKLHDFYGFKPIFRAHYSPDFVRDVIILILRPRGKIVESFFRFFNNLVGTTLLSIVLKIAKSLFPLMLTYPTEKYPDASIKCMIKNFEKLPKN